MALAAGRRRAHQLGRTEVEGPGAVVRQGWFMTADPLGRVARLAQNLWWSWNGETQRLFASMDPALWEATGHNPIKTLRLLEPHQRERLNGDARFVEAVARCEKHLAQYLSTSTWYERTDKRG